jgi:PRC-barrel domain
MRKDYPMFVSARKLLDIALVACIAYPSAQCAFGQTIRPASPPGQEAPNAQPGANRTFAPGAAAGNHSDNRILQGSMIIGSNVMLQGGASYGTLRDFVISDSGCLEYAVIAADNGLVAVPWNAGMFDFGRRAFMLDFGRDRVRDLPRIRDIAELRNPQIQKRVQTFFRGDHNTPGNARGAENQPRGAENQPRGENQNRGTVRGAAPTQRPEGTEQRPASPGNERREK